MRRRSSLIPICLFIWVSVLVLGNISSAQTNEKELYACSGANSEALCSAANKCGSASVPCEIDIKKSPYAVALAAATQQARDNALFCVEPGTQITFKSSKKNTGFLVDFGPASPFTEADAIAGGSNRPETRTVGAKPGCYRFSVGACVSGAVEGMCNTTQAEVVVTGN